jgi:hypothetical protein
MKRDLSPKTLVILAIAGSGLAASTWFLSFVHIPLLPATGRGVLSAIWEHSPRIVAFFVPGVLGFAVALWAEKQFKRGFQDDRWSEGDLASIKRLITQPFWIGSALLVLLVAVLYMITDKHMKGGSLIYLLTLPSQTVGRLRQLIAPPAPRNTVLAGWSSFQPIQSDHWGSPRT